MPTWCNKVTFLAQHVSGTYARHAAYGFMHRVFGWMVVLRAAAWVVCTARIVPCDSRHHAHRTLNMTWHEIAAAWPKQAVHSANCVVLAEECVYVFRSAGVKHSLLLNDENVFQSCFGHVFDSGQRSSKPMPLSAFTCSFTLWVKMVAQE